MIARLVRPALLLAATAALSACTAYDGYGSSRVSVGYSSGYPYGYSPYSYYGWYDGFYYPGNGYYIYDSYGARHRWSDRHRNYWEGRRGGRRGGDNWDGYRRDRDGRYHDGNRGGGRASSRAATDGEAIGATIPAVGATIAPAARAARRKPRAPGPNLRPSARARSFARAVTAASRSTVAASSAAAAPTEA